MDRSASAVPLAVGPYAVLGQIGAGGMATVHLGRERASGRVVAIKRMRPHLVAEPALIKSFLDEARLSARIHHPNVVGTLAVEHHDGEAFLILEYVEGVSLSALTRGTPPPALPPSIAVAVLSDVLRGLHAAHEALNEAGEPLHLVHRDVSPHNVLVGVDGIARVLDFGIAKALGRQNTTRDGAIKGKLEYMAPEQLSGRAATRRTDVFAAGIVLWQLLTGERLFQADDEAATVGRVLMEPVRAPSAVRAGLPAALDRVVLRALERDPSRRFLTADEMAEAMVLAVAPASRAEVGEWVRSASGGELARRATLLAGVSPDAPSSAAHAGGDGGASRRRRVVVALAAVGSVCVAGAIFAARRAALPPHAAEGVTPPVVVTASAAPSSSPEPAPTVADVPSGPAAVVSPSAPAPAPSPRGLASARHTRAPSAPKAAPSAHERLYSRD